MKKQIIILILTTIWLASCSISPQDSIEEKDCLFKFKIEVESENSYVYNSENGQLKKIIDPFQRNTLYADTILLLTEANICQLMTLFDSKNIINYPVIFRPKSSFEMNPEPSYRIQFTINGKNKNINWSKNTGSFETKDAYNLNEIIKKIDSLILTSSEFKGLPEQHYDWE